jgi:NAD(P)-dependent dehydrogenase (short-subunit alcohol dehydrogenase family)
MPTIQAPINSGFGPRTTARETLQGLDLTGKVAIVTGGYSGIGLETTRALAAAGATVIVPARTAAKARLALQGIARVEQASLDLLDPEAIDAFAGAFLASGRPLHMLINNAGIMGPPLARDGRGYESQLSANHLGPFQLTARLWPALRAAGGARVVALSSRGHQRAAFDFEDPNVRHGPYDPMQAYGRSKTANALFAVALDRRGQAECIRAFAVHPGAVLSDLIRHMTDTELAAYGLSRTSANGPIPPGLSVDEGGAFKTPEQGAATSVWCAAHPRLAGMGGVYCENVELAQVRRPGATGHDGVEPWAIDPDLAERLWTLSEQLTGATLPVR